MGSAHLVNDEAEAAGLADEVATAGADAAAGSSVRANAADTARHCGQSARCDSTAVASTDDRVPSAQAASVSGST